MHALNQIDQFEIEAKQKCIESKHLSCPIENRWKVFLNDITYIYQFIYVYFYNFVCLHWTCSSYSHTHTKRAFTPRTVQIQYTIEDRKTSSQNLHFWWHIYFCFLVNDPKSFLPSLWSKWNDFFFRRWFATKLCVTGKLKTKSSIYFEHQSNNGKHYTATKSLNTPVMTHPVKTFRFVDTKRANIHTHTNTKNVFANSFIMSFLAIFSILLSVHSILNCVWRHRKTYGHVGLENETFLTLYGRYQTRNFFFRPHKQTAKAERKLLC